MRHGLSLPGWSDTPDQMLRAADGASCCRCGQKKGGACNMTPHRENRPRDLQRSQRMKCTVYTICENRRLRRMRSGRTSEGEDDLPEQVALDHRGESVR